MSVREDISHFAAAGDAYAVKLEDHYDIVVNETAFEAVRPMLTKFIRKVNAGVAMDSTLANLKAVSHAFVQFMGYKTLSGIIPKSVYNTLLLSLNGLSDSVDANVLTLKARIIHCLSDKDFVVSQYDPKVDKDDYLEFFMPQKITKSRKGGNK